MELKLLHWLDKRLHGLVLIVPSGIETEFSGSSLNTFIRVLIVPSGIETSIGCLIINRNRVLIVPSGIETRYEVTYPIGNP